ncbi:hypothetical protein Tco_0047746 [Tanacetum coccineum]
MTMSLMHQWHDTICGGVIGPRRSLLYGAYGCILGSVWMHPRDEEGGSNWGNEMEMDEGGFGDADNGAEDYAKPNESDTLNNP